MSLDVHLISKTKKVAKFSSGIFIREGGETREISIEEWNMRFPGKEPVRFTPSEEETNVVYHANITHNLGQMASEAGIYEYLWRPEEVGVTEARQLIKPLADGLEKLIMEPERFKRFNPENGWGTYEQLVKFVGKYWFACLENPDAEVSADR